MNLSPLAEIFYRGLKESLDYNQYDKMNNLTPNQRKAINDNIAKSLANCYQELNPKTSDLARSQKDLLDLLEHASMTFHSMKESIMNELGIEESIN